MNILTLLVLGIIFILMNAFFVVAEFSLLRVRKTRLQKLFESNAWGSSSLKKIMGNLNFYIISSQIGITSTTLALGFTAQDFLLQNSSDSWSVFFRIFILLVSLLVVTGLHSIFGEIAPKIIAIQHIESLALRVAPPLYWISWFFSPVTFAIEKVSVFLLKLVKLNTVSELYSRVYSEDELKILVAQSQREGEIDKSEERLINRVLDFTDTRVNEIFTPRYEIVAFDLSTPVDEIVAKARETGYSRFPVYDEKLDQVAGFVHVKDLIIADMNDPNFSIKQVMRPVFTIHEAMRLDMLLRKMQQDRSQVAIVVDEYGSVEGLVTIEDIIEAIVGPIDDEFDIGSVELVKKIGRNKYSVDGRVTLDVFNQAFQCNLEAEDSVTIAGFILEHLESVPTEGSKLYHEGKFANFDFIVTSMDGNRVDKAQVVIRKRKVQIDNLENVATTQSNTATEISEEIPETD